MSLSVGLADSGGGVGLQAGVVDPLKVPEGALPQHPDLVLAEQELVHLELVLGVVVRHLLDHVVGQVYKNNRELPQA